MLEQAFGLLINEIALDIGTANIRVYSKGRATLIEEPAIVIIKEEKGRNQLIEYGTSALAMIGRTPANHKVVFPFQNGIAEPKIAKMLLDKIIMQALGGKSLLKPRSIAGFSLYFQNEARHTLSNILRQSTGRDVQFIESLICSALGCELPIHESQAMMLIDIGYSGTEVGVLCHANIYRKHYLPIGGKHFNLAIQQYLIKKYQLFLGLQQIEELKKNHASVEKPKEREFLSMMGKNHKTHQPMEQHISNEDLHFALQPPLNILIQGLQRFFQKLSSRVVSDLIDNGILLCGGSAQCKGLQNSLQDTLMLPVISPEEHGHAMVKGAAALLKTEPYEHWLIQN